MEADENVRICWDDPFLFPNMQNWLVSDRCLLMTRESSTY